MNYNKHLVQVKSMVRVTGSQTFLDLIFPMQVSLGNKKSLGLLKKLDFWLLLLHF